MIQTTKIEIPKPISIFLLIVLILLPDFLILYPTRSYQTFSSIFVSFVGLSLVHPLGLIQVLLISILLFLSKHWRMSFTVINSWFIISFLLTSYSLFRASTLPASTGAAGFMGYVGLAAITIMFAISFGVVAIFNAIFGSIYQYKYKPRASKKY